MNIGLYLYGTNTLDINLNRNANMQGDEIIAINLKKQLERLGVSVIIFSQPRDCAIFDYVIYFNPDLQKISPKEKSILYVQNTYTDIQEITKKFSQTASNFCSFIFVSALLKERCQAEGHVMPFACDIESNVEFDNLSSLYRDQYQFDCSFLGNPLPRFPNWMEKHITPIMNFNSAIFSKHPWPAPFSSKWRGGLPLQDTPNLYYSTKININVHIAGHAYNGVVNYRIFEVLGAGGFVLSDYFKEIDDIFDGSVAFTDGGEEQTESIKMYLADHILRISKVQKGFEIVKAKHTFKHRAEDLYKYLGGL